MDYSLIARLKCLFPWTGAGTLLFAPNEKLYNVFFWSNASSWGPPTYRAYYKRCLHCLEKGEMLNLSEN